MQCRCTSSSTMQPLSSSLQRTLPASAALQHSENVQWGHHLMRLVKCYRQSGPETKTETLVASMQPTKTHMCTHAGEKGFNHIMLLSADGALEAAPAMGSADIILDLVGLRGVGTESGEY